MIPPRLGFKLWVIPHRSHRIGLHTSQQADLEKVPHAWYVGVCNSEQIQSQMMVSLPGSNDFIGKPCINFFLFVSLSFPSIWSHSGYVEVGGSHACSLWPLSVPVAVWAFFLAVPDCCPMLCRAAGHSDCFLFSGDRKVQHAVTWPSPFHRSGCATCSASTVSPWWLFMVASWGTLTAGELRYLLTE